MANLYGFKDLERVVSAKQCVIRAGEKLHKIYPFLNDPKYLISVLNSLQDAIDLIPCEYDQIRKILRFHKNAAVIFRRGNKFVMCDQEYNYVVISYELLCRFLSEVSELLEDYP